MTDNPDVGALVPIAYVVQSLRDGSIGNLIAPTAWSTFEDAKERLEQDPWIVNGAAKLAPLYSHETVLALQAEIARLTQDNERLAGEVAAFRIANSTFADNAICCDKPDSCERACLKRIDWINHKEPR